MIDLRAELIARADDFRLERGATTRADWLADKSAAVAAREPPPVDGELILQATIGDTLVQGRWSEAEGAIVMRKEAARGLR